MTGSKRGDNLKRLAGTFAEDSCWSKLACVLVKNFATAAGGCGTDPVRLEWPAPAGGPAGVQALSAVRPAADGMGPLAAGAGVWWLSTSGSSGLNQRSGS